jgi:hypothetical protein
MKIDIQGGDLQAFQGTVKTIENSRIPILKKFQFTTLVSNKSKYYNHE